MNNDFPRILALLRSEKHISQKQAAEDLGIAQALLSHYEKGKRECGLDFLVRAADYYKVSTDYLLGRSPVSTGQFLLESEIPEAGLNSNKAESFTFSSSLAKKLIISGIDVIFSILGKTKSKKLTQSITTILSLNIYKSFRLVYKLNPKNDKNLFIINEEAAFRAAAAGELLAEGAALTAIAEDRSENTETAITTASLESEYNKQAAALLNLIRNSENMLKRYE
ncbi:MAG: helix-turn-helix domain-containing protein [Oscillospiraceae bacterium]|nr:helix-turn-helix domain-containing protein [Oscillospiraceae bacterium]